MVRADGRECWWDSTDVCQNLHKHPPSIFSFLKDACKPSILIPISQSIKYSINISGKKGNVICAGQMENKKITKAQASDMQHSAQTKHY